MKLMQTCRLFTLLLLSLMMAVPLRGQKEQRDPLTPDQRDKIAEAGIDPVARVELFTKFLNEHADVIQRLIKRSENGRDARIDGELQDLSALMDDLGSNLDMLGDRKADIRSALKPLNESILRWQKTLNDLPSHPGFQVSRDEAIDAAKDLADQTTQLIAEQKTYFDEHKDEKGQDRAEPK